MKFIKLTKTGWLILAAGVFVVVLASLGVTRTQQLKEKGKLDQDLQSSTQILEKIQTSDLRQQIDDTQQKVDETQVLRDEAAQSLNETVVSVDVSDELFTIANYCGVTVMHLVTSPIRQSQLENVQLDSTTMNVQVDGELPNLVNFVNSLNNDYKTGFIKSYQISVPNASTSNETPSASIQMIIYSYEENNNG
jgi:hypothetical protein